MSTNSSSIRGAAPLIGICGVILCSVASRAAAQDSLRAVRDSLRLARESAVIARSTGEVVPIAEQAATSIRGIRVVAPWYAAQAQNVPQDVRIMRTIVRTALSDVEAPAMPKDLSDDSAASHGASIVAPSGQSLIVYSDVARRSFLGRGDVSGFYMQGYGYLFTVRWPVGSAVAFTNVHLDAGVRGEHFGGDDARAKEMNAWAAAYRQRLSYALRDAIAGYGSTLHRAKPGESITFLADFGGGDSASVTMTVKADALHGSNVEANRDAIQVSTGQSGMSRRLHTQLQIMSQIVDTSLRPESSGGEIYVGNFDMYFGGRTEPQYVPGYGVIFRKTARLNTARAFASFSTSPRRGAAVDSSEAAARKTYQAHLDTLRDKTSQIFATYGPTLTELKEDDWVGIYYDVGSAAALLNGGMDNYLVQARMRDIRQAATQRDPAAWLVQHLVTNEKED